MKFFRVYLVSYILLLLFSCNSKTINEFKFEKDNPYYYFVIAETNFIRGYYDIALKNYDKVLSLQADNLFVVARKGACLVATGKLKEGRVLLRNAIKNGLLDQKILLLFVKVSDSKKDARLLSKAYDEILKLDPKNKIITYRKVDSLLRDRQYKKAVDVLKKYLKAVPDDYAMVFLLASVYRDAGQHYKAKNLLRKLGTKQSRLDAIIELLALYRENSTDQEYLDHLINLYNFNHSDFILYEMFGSLVKILKKGINSQRYLDILEKYMPLLEDDLPLEKSLYLRVIQVLFDLKEYDLALDSLRRASASVNDSAIRYATAVAYLYIGDTDDAVPLLRSIDAKSKFFESSIKRLVSIYNDNESYKDSIDLLNSVRTKLKDNKTYFLLLASVYEGMKKYKKAEELVAKLFRDNKEDSKLALYYASLLEKVDKKEESIDVAKTILEREPENLKALNYIAYNYAELSKNLDEAERMVNKVLAKTPNDPYIIDTKAWILFKKGNFKEAAKLLKKAIKLIVKKQNVDEILFEHIIQVLLKENNIEEAKDYLNTLKGFSSNQHLLNKLQRAINEKLK